MSEDLNRLRGGTTSADTTPLLLHRENRGFWRRHGLCVYGGGEKAILNIFSLD